MHSSEKDKKISPLVEGILSLEEEVSALRKKCKSLESKLNKRQIIISELEAKLAVSDFRAKQFYTLLSQNTEIDIKTLYKESFDEIFVYCAKPGESIPIIVSELGADEEYKRMLLSTTGTTKGKKFRKVTKVKDRNKEDLEEVEKIRKQFMDIAEDKCDVSVKDTTKLVHSCLESMGERKALPSSALKEVAAKIIPARIKLLGKLGIERYVEHVNKDIKKIKEVISKKKYDAKKISEIISTLISPLEQRLLYFGQYYKTELEIDEIEIFRDSIKTVSVKPTSFTPFSQAELCSRLRNYGIALFPLKEILEIALIRYMGFPSIVYIDSPKSTEKDRYTFYILGSVREDGRRQWEMCCRLFELSKTISEILLDYCVDMFRRIYKDVFGDNIYRENYKDKAEGVSRDCEQLYQNIYFLAGKKRFCDLLRKSVAKFCTISPGIQDSVNFTGDDTYIRKEYIKALDMPEDIACVLGRMFDEISREDIERLAV